MKSETKMTVNDELLSGGLSVILILHGDQEDDKKELGSFLAKQRTTNDF